MISASLEVIWEMLVQCTFNGLEVAFQVLRITSDAGILLTLEPAAFDAIAPAGPVQA